VVNARVVKLAAVACLAASLLVGCDNVRTRTVTLLSPEPSGAQSADEFQGLVQYAQWLRSRAPETLDTARGEAEKRLQESDSALARVRLALVLSLPGTNFQNEARARSLLEKVTQTPGEANDGVHAFATMLATNLEDRQWVRERMNHELEAERKQYQKELVSERQQREQLQQKLDKLKAIEQQLNRRDQTNAGAPK
jgi:hypothetical protein